MRMSARFQLQTPRLRLRRLVRGDLEDLLALDADPEVMRFISGGVPSTREQYESSLLDRMTAYDDQPFGFAAAHQDDAFVGWFHLRPSVADAEVLELGYRLRRAAWGRGLATEGSRALVRYAMDTLGRDEVDACADPRNAASIRVMEKCGMHRVGTLVHPRGGMEVVRYLVRSPRASTDAQRGDG